MIVQLQALQPRTPMLRFGALSVQDKAQLVKTYQQGQLISWNVDTQVDFMLPSKKNPRKRLYVPGAEKIIPKAKALTQLVKELAIPRVDSMDDHSPDDPEFSHFKAISDSHCIHGTRGWKKLKATTLSNKPWIITDDANKSDLPNPAEFKAHASKGNPFFIYKKTSPVTGNAHDVFTNPKAETLLRVSGAKAALVDGVCTDICVKMAVEGLIKRGITVYAVEDAMKGLKPEPHPDYEVYNNPQVKRTTVNEVRDILLGQSAQKSA